MSSKQFNAHYTLGIDSIDRDHWMLIGIMNVINAAVKANDTAKVVERIKVLLTRLTDHCVREEAFMVKINYPFLAYHKKSHTILLQNMVKIVHDLEEGLPNPDLQDALYEVLVAHVDSLDLQVSEYVKSTLQTEAHI
jgi:hemerythrin-like metal-binding protein